MSSCKDRQSFEVFRKTIEIMVTLEFVQVFVFLKTLPHYRAVLGPDFKGEIIFFCYIVRKQQREVNFVHKIKVIKFKKIFFSLELLKFITSKNSPFYFSSFIVHQLRQTELGHYHSHRFRFI